VVLGRMKKAHWAAAATRDHGVFFLLKLLVRPSPSGPASAARHPVRVI
jgi:hypothetical protein